MAPYMRGLCGTKRCPVLNIEAFKTTIDCLVTLRAVATQYAHGRVRVVPLLCAVRVDWRGNSREQRVWRGP